MASSTYMTFLMKKGTGDTYTKLVDIKDFPDIGGESELLEITSLSDKMQRYIEGIQNSDALPFTLNYDLETYETLLALKGVETDYAIWFGGTESNGTVTPTGSEGKFAFSGYASVRVLGKGVNEVREMELSIAPSSEITLEA